MKVEIPDALAQRVKTFCLKNQIDIQSFVFDAIIEKLENVHKEKRRRQRI